MSATEIATYSRLSLSILLWLLSSKQAYDARKTLNEIKSSIITWQSELNTATINIISSRPEVIAKDSALAETKSMSEFSSRLTKLIENSALSKPDGNTEYQLQVLDKLLDHHKSLILGKQQLLSQAISRQTGHQPVTPKTKQKEGNE